jgi:hypothetical protein
MSHSRLLRDLQPHLRAIESAEATRDTTSDTTPEQQDCVSERTTQGFQGEPELTPQAEARLLCDLVSALRLLEMATDGRVN